MAVLTKIDGVKDVIENMRKAKKEKIKGLVVGLKRGGLFLQRESQKVVPVDTGKLRASAYTRAEGLGLQTVVRVGYTAEYAIYVHENLNARHKPGKIAKFLEKPARENKDKIKAIILKAVADA